MSEIKEEEEVQHTHDRRSSDRNFRNRHQTIHLDYYSTELCEKKK